jgi:hypothetical protein
MVDVNTSYPDFSAGEISPKMYGRFDLAAFYRGGRRVENFIPQTTGAAQFRTGTVFAAKTRLGRKARLYTFQISADIAFVLEFTDDRIRFFRNNGQVRRAAQSITGVTQATTAVVTYSGADTYVNGQSVIIYGVEGMTELNGGEYQIANVDTGANTFELVGINSTGFAAYTGGGSIESIVEVTTTYDEADLFQLKFAAQGNTLYIVHPSYAPQKLVYTSATSWAFSAHAPIQKSFGSPQNITAITRANPAVVTYTGADNFSNGDTVFIDGIVGMIELNGEEYTVANVNTGTNTFELQGVNTTGFSLYSNAGTIQKVTSSAAPFLSSGEYPAAVAFYEQRLVYGGGNDFPNTLYFSKSGEVDDFTNGAEVDDAITYTIGGSSNAIVWIIGTTRFLAVGCVGDVYQVTGGIDNVITPTSISIRPTNGYGVADMVPIGRGSQVFYMQNNRLILRSYEYDLQADGYIPVDRNTIAEHITSSGITQIDFQEGRPNALWSVKGNGELIGMTIEDTEAISGWHRHKTDGDFVSYAALPRSIEYDQSWFCVRRDIDGQSVHYIEYMADFTTFPRRMDYVITESKEEDDLAFARIMNEVQKEYIHVDCSATYRGDGQAVTITPDAVTGTGITFTASGSVFTANMVGREIWRKSVEGTEFGRARIVSYTSATEVDCDILEDFDSTDVIPADEWYLTAQTISGLDHLEGKTVKVVVDGGQHPDLEVTGGSVALDRQSSVVHIGLAYVGYLETNDLEGGGVTGTAQTKRKNVHAVGIRFLDTLYAKVGTSYYGGLRQIEMRTASMRMDRPPLLYTGDEKVTYANETNDVKDGGWSRSKRVIISQDQPFPCNVQLIVPYFAVSN